LAVGVSSLTSVSCVAARTRVYATVLAAAVLVAGGVVVITWLQARGEPTSAATVKARKGIPPLLFDFGLRNDREVQDLARGAALLKAGRRAQAEALFARYHDVQAQLGTAFAKWPDLDEVEHIAAAHPDSAVAQLHLGLALVYAGRDADAATTLKRVETQFPDSPSSVDAENLLYSRDFPGLPYLIVPVTVPAAPTLAQQVAIAARDARRDDAQAKLRYGVMLWRLQHRVSARRWLDAAAKRDPSAETLTAAAVSAFTKRNPVAAFGRLGPLTGRYPNAPVVRFHLGILLLWTHQLAKAKTQLQMVLASHPDSLYGKEARKLLAALGPNGTK
jgi:tetratricopeptide (TPR) repeat protein